MIEWQSAQVAEQKAISDHYARRVDARKRDDADIVQLAAQGRVKHARMLHVRQYHQQRCETSEFQCALARCCVETQQNAIELMQSELATVTALLNEAKQAQEDCRTSSHRLQVIKRQIENVSVRINDIRLRNEEQQRLRLISSSNRKNSNKSRGGLVSSSSLSLSDPKTPGSIDHPRSALYQGTNQESSEIA
uniref:Uncharacterized protein n=1 Tax=Globisporangium ultimum (strain ATCC 200006 / CBS 805.95 / DAOM BR144) TaxID=431595 RepID=K3W562_GLOUD